MKLAVIGADHWHMPRHFESFTRAGAQFVAFHSESRAIAERWAATAGPGSLATTDLHELLEHGYDLVLAMPRHDRTRQVVQALIGRGQPFVLEKPGGVAASSLAGLAAEADGLFASVAYINKYGRIWPALERGGFPAPTYARFRIVNGSPERYRADGVDWVLEPKLSGGGALRNIGSHAVEAFLTLATGAVSVEGAVQSDRRYDLDVEDHAVALMRDETGLVGIIEAGYVLPEQDGTDQVWTIGGPGFELTETDESLTQWTASGRESQPSRSVPQRYDLFAADTLVRLRRGDGPLSGLGDAYDVLSLLDRVYDASSLDPASVVRSYQTLP